MIVNKGTTDYVKSWGDVALRTLPWEAEKFTRTCLAHIFAEGRTLRDEQLLFLVCREVLQSQAGGHVLDVGAHLGRMTEHFLACNPFKRIHAIEPHPELAARLRLRFPHSVEIHNIAASDQHQHRPLWESAEASSLSSLTPNARHPQHPGVTVQADRLELIIPQNLHHDFALAKFDVEGHEFPALCGAEGILRASRPVIIFEHVHEWGLSPVDTRRLYAYLDSLGYKIFTLGAWLDDVAPLSAQELVQSASHWQATDYVAMHQDGRKTKFR